MDGKRFAARSRVVVIALLAVLTAFAGVLYDLQVVNGSYYLEQSTKKIVNTETVQAARGEVLDRYGRVLISNRVTYQVTLDTKLMGDIQGRNNTVLALLKLCEERNVDWADNLPVTMTAPFQYTVESPFETVRVAEDGTETRSPTQLARLVELLKLRQQKNDPLPAEPTAEELITSLRTYFEVDENLSRGEGRGLVGVLYELALRSWEVTYSNYVFTKDVDIGFITVVKERGLAGVKIDTVTVREFNTQYAAHLLGQVGSVSFAEWPDYQALGYSMDAIVGKFGVEQAFEEVLRGTAGTKMVEYNQNGKITSESWYANETTGEILAPEPGNNVMLTLDIRLQEVVEQALERYVPGMTEESEKGACVVVDMTGGVLAAATYPSYDPAEYYTNYNALLADEKSPLYNRALQGLYPPGSTIKMAVAAGALEEGVITRSEKILDTGRYKHYDRIQDQPMCWYYRQYGQTHGYENVSEAIRDSCNVYFYETGIRLGIERLDKYAAMFGLGELTGLELYEAQGEVAGPKSSERHGQTWYEGETMYAAIGQGNTQVTPIQLANYIATLVNGGTHYETHLLQAVKSSDFSEMVEEYAPRTRDELDLNKDNMEAVKYGMYMVANEGSAASYFRDLPVKVGAKTGTAQVSANTEAHALLVAFAPYEDPEIAVAIVVEHGGSGTLVAAIAADILDYYFSARDAMDAPAAENTLVK
ncbi:MAG: penicillin-binding protein [Oscillospiraceae bacterium]|nr:penicillin-binding protein [Oscillospiraceae bacterium]